MNIAGKRVSSRSNFSNGNIAVSLVINPRRISVNSRPRNVKRIKRIKELERELKRKDAALAETAALLVLRKKLNAYWGEDEDN